jgi:hypothetical protein
VLVSSGKGIYDSRRILTVRQGNADGNESSVLELQSLQVSTNVSSLAAVAIVQVSLHGGNDMRAEGRELVDDPSPHFNDRQELVCLREGGILQLLHKEVTGLVLVLLLFVNFRLHSGRRGFGGGTIKMPP